MCQEVFIWFILALLFSCAGVPLLYSLIFTVLLDEFFCDVRPRLQETLFDCLEQTYWNWSESAACKYCASSGLDVCDRILFATVSVCYVPRGTSHIPVYLFLVRLIISFPFFWIDISCLFSLMVNPSSHKTPNAINGSFYILGKIWIYLTCFIIPVSRILLYVSTPLWFNLVVLFSYDFPSL